MAWRHITETRNDRVFAHIPDKHRKTSRRRIWYTYGLEDADAGLPMRSMHGLVALEIVAYSDGYQAVLGAPASRPAM